MEIKNFNLDRKQPDSDYIASKQDFKKLMNDFKAIKNPVWKQPIFYGVIGFASISAIIIGSVFSGTEIVPNENPREITQSQQVTQPKVMLAGIESPSRTTRQEDKSISNEPFKRTSIDKNVTKTNEQAPQSSEIEEVYEVISEPEIISTNKSVNARIPQINGNYYGNISVKDLCSTEGITLSDGSKIDSFKFQYTRGTSVKVLKVDGNKIPEEVCTYFKESKDEQMVFITEIYLINGVSKEALPSMNFWVKES